MMPRRQTTYVPAPRKIGGKYVVARHTRSAASAASELAPNAVSIVMSAASTMPKPPGVIGIAPRSRAHGEGQQHLEKAHLVGADPDRAGRQQQQSEIGQLARQDRHGQTTGPLVQDVAGLSAEANDGALDPV